jgi:hypothetical protein
VKYDIYEATLRKWLKLNLTGDPKGGGWGAILTEEQERELCERLLQISNMFYGVILTDHRRIEYKFADRNNVKNNFNHEIN